MFNYLLNYFNWKKVEETVSLHQFANYYSVSELTSKKIGNLGHFFISDVGGHKDFWVEFLNNPERPETQSNWCVLEKDGDEIRIFDFLTEERAQPYPVSEDQVLRIKNSELQKLLYQWDEILSRDPLPSQIKITEKRGVFKMEAID